MYVPAAFAVPAGDTAAAARFIAAHGFATLTLATAQGLEAAPLPFVYEAGVGQGRLLAHVARANPIWTSFGTAEALVLFAGPDAYVSPDWYETPHMVPTWNYEALHVYGVPRVLERAAEAERVLAALSARYEADLLPKAPWTLGKLPSDLLRGLLKGIVAFEIPVARLVLKRKLSQNRSPADRAGVIRALQQRPDAGSRAIARLMAALEKS